MTVCFRRDLYPRLGRYNIGYLPASLGRTQVTEPP